MSSVTFADVQTAEKRISPFIHKTPVLESQLLNSWLGHKLFFKAECFQKTGAFKLRGALNMMLKAKEEGRLGRQVVASSSGNHAQAVAYIWLTLGAGLQRLLNNGKRRRIFNICMAILLLLSIVPIISVPIH